MMIIMIMVRMLIFTMMIKMKLIKDNSVGETAAAASPDFTAAVANNVDVDDIDDDGNTTSTTTTAAAAIIITRTTTNDNFNHYDGNGDLDYGCYCCLGKQRLQQQQ